MTPRPAALLHRVRIEAGFDHLMHDFAKIFAAR